jgi:sugar-specific transcriptional regulator TrmB
VIKLLEGFGFSKSDAEVYIYLAKKGPRKETDLSEAFNFTDKKLDLILNNLKSKGLVMVAVEQSEVFLALPFESVLDQLVNSDIQRVTDVVENKEGFLARWRSILQREDF